MGAFGDSVVLELTEAGVRGAPTPREELATGRGTCVSPQQLPRAVAQGHEVEGCASFTLQARAHTHARVRTHTHCHHGQGWLAGAFQ